MKMINSVHIKNFKSVVDLKLELGTFNVLIGENGSGKSNILEGLAFGAAASADKLDFEFLGSRGIRLSNPDLMTSAFQKDEEKKLISIEFKTNDENFNNYKYLLFNDPNNSKKWINVEKEVKGKSMRDFLKSILLPEDSEKHESTLHRITSKTSNEDLSNSLRNTAKLITDFLKEPSNDSLKEEFSSIIDEVVNDRFSNNEISDFIVYAPEHSSLRKFEDTTQIYPLGIKGEGAFQFLKEISSDKKNKKKIQEIKDFLMILDWYEDFEIPKNLMSMEHSLNIKDRYLSDNLIFFDQRSTNEGFLYLLFYSILFSSNQTPNFFAIDNIDNSFNPKLCTQLVKNLSALAKKHKKQVIVTTHNPAVLDGLNLKDKNQKLFVVRRNDDGHTVAKPIEYNSKRKMKLSEVWMNGFIGGLPENF